MSRSPDVEALARSVDGALRACRHAMDVTLESTGPNYPLREAKRTLADAIEKVRRHRDLALETALLDLDERLSPYAEGARLLSVARLEELERFLGRAEVLFRLSQHSSAKPPDRAHPLPLSARPRGSADLGLRDDEVDAGGVPSVVPMRERVEREVYEEVVGVFALEARDQLDRLAAAIRGLQRDGVDEARLRIRERMRAMKSSSALVGVEDVRRVAHVGEDFAESLLRHGADEIDHELLAELHRALETLTLGDAAARSTVDAVALVERVEDRIEVRELGGDAASTEDRVTVVEEPAVDTGSESTSEDGSSGARDDQAEPHAQREGDSDPEQTAAARRLGEALNRQGPPEVESSPRISAGDPAFRILSEVENSVTLIERRREGLLPLGRELRRSSARLSEALALLRDESGEERAVADREEALERLAEAHREIEASELQLALGSTGIENELRNLRRHTQRLERRLEDLARTSLDSISSSLGRLVQVSADREGKLVGLELHGFETPMDQGIASAIAEALRHLARNAVEHGVERPELRRLRGKPTEGRVRIEVRRDGPRVVVDVSDDGRGFQSKELIDAALRLGEVPRGLAGSPSGEDLWRLATLSGISSRKSAAGAGLDLVRARIESLGGSAELLKTSGNGSTVRFSVPVEVTVQRALFLESGGHRVAIASGSVVRVVRRGGDRRGDEASGVVKVEGVPYSLVDLGEWLGPPIATDTGPSSSMVLIEDEDRRLALRVGRVWDAGELPIYPKGPLLERFSGISGFGRTEAGDVIPIIDALALARGDRPGRHAQPRSSSDGQSQRAVLVVDDAPSVLRVVGLLLQRLGVRPLLAGDGSEALRLLEGETESPWMALIDVAMPEMDGFALTEAIRAQGHRDVPVYLFTSPSGSLPAADDHGVEGYVFKPLVRRELAALLKRHRGSVQIDTTAADAGAEEA